MGYLFQQAKPQNLIFTLNNEGKVKLMASGKPGNQFKMLLHALERVGRNVNYIEFVVHGEKKNFQITLTFLLTITLSVPH